MQYVVSTSEFDDVKSRLATIENRHKILDKKDDGKKPSLRRTSAGSDSTKTCGGTASSGNFTGGGVAG